jgi:hypothetical protein
MKIINNILVQKSPDTIELRAYLGQIIRFTDKRDFITLSFEIENYILNEFNFETNIFDFILNDLEIEQIKKILTKFDLFTEKIYFFTTDKDCYTEFYFENIVVDGLNKNNPTTGKNSNDDDSNDDDSNHNILNEEDFMENRFGITDIPNLYSKIHDLSLGENGLMIMEMIPNNCYEIYDFNGVNISNLFLEIIEESFDVECLRISSAFLGENNTILIFLGGRVPSWFVFEKYKDEITLVEFSNNNEENLLQDFKFQDSSELIENYLK